ncbi:MAG: HigA family addiction module antitoxin [Pseudomonadota bacterium]
MAKRDFPPVHPGEILKKEFLEPLALSAYALAGATGMPRTRINDILLGRRGISADTALRLARYFGTDAQSWLNLQTRYDLEVASAALADRLKREVKPRAA